MLCICYLELCRDSPRHGLAQVLLKWSFSSVLALYSTGCQQAKRKQSSFPPARADIAQRTRIWPILGPKRPLEVGTGACPC